MPLEEVVLAQAFLEAPLNVLERRGVVWNAEVLAEITRLREKSVDGRYNPHERRGNPRRSRCG